MNGLKNAFVRAFYRYVLRKDNVIGINSIFENDYIIDKRLMAIDWQRNWNVLSMGEYIRTSSLELVAKEIYENKVIGSVVELGVWQGDFASRINFSFSDRKLYLFDTFEGFDHRDIDVDRKNRFSTGQQDFSKTSIDLVLDKMPYKTNCITKKGYFPESLEGLEDIFCFVSIDTDLFQPTLEGLKYFYPRLSKGGYIFVHDYNNFEYSGVKKAVRLYCCENNIGYFPLCDPYGTAIIIK